MAIRLENVKYTYMPGTPFEKEALSGINLEIGDGELTAIIGHTGSGKTTLMQLFNGLLQPTEGRVIVDGEVLCRKTAAAIRRKVGYVFQYPESQLFEETVAKDIAFALKREKISREETEKRVLEAIETVGLDESFLERSIFELSGGQKRRVAIAGVIVSKPSYLLLDEPASGLDPAGKKEMLEFLKGLNDKGITVVFVSHDMDDVTETAKRVIVVDNGKIFADGTPREVFSRGGELKSCGLDTPEITKLFQALNERLPFIRPDVFSLEEGKNELMRLKCEGRLGL